MAVLSSQPRSLGWLLTIPGTLITLLLWFFLSNAFDEARKLAAFEQLQTAMQKGKSTVASRDLRVLNETRISTSLRREFDSLFVELEDTLNTRELTILSNLVSSITATSGEDFHRALNSVKNASRFVPEGSQLASTLEDFASTLENATIASDERAALESRLRSLDKNGEKLKITYFEARQALEKFLGLEIESARSKDFSFYKSGVLSGLPIVKGLPDGLKNAQELREALSVIGGAVQVSPKNPREDYELKMSNIKELASDAREPLEKYLHERSTIVQAMKRDTQALTAVREAVVESLSPRLLSNTRPSTSGLAEKILEGLKTLGLA